ncbi:MAG: MFS transporter, partial [Chloroflexi bacterium]|nr:MFS transporter [Chloroflexota bacterium]
MATPLSEDNPAGNERLWTTDFVLNLLVGHFMFASYTSLLTIIPPYVFHRGGQEWQLGIIIGSFGIVGIFIRPFAGRWINILGAKRVTVAGTAIIAAGSLLYIGAFSPWSLIPVRMLQGIGIAMAPVATSTMVANLAPAHRRAEAMSYMGNSINISFLYAPVLSSLILTYGGFHNAFLFSGLAAILATLFALRISSRHAVRVSHPPTSADADRVPLISRAALFPTIVFMAYTLTTAPISTFLPILATQQGLGNPGLFYTVFSATSIVAMFVAGPMADRFGRATVIVPGLIATAVAMFVLNAAFFPLMLWGAGFFAGLGFGMIQPGIQSLTVDRVSTRERSAGMATLQQAWDIGGSGGAFAMGPLGGFIGIGNVFGLTGVGALVGALGFMVGNKRKPASLSSRVSPQVSSGADKSETAD